MRAVLAFTCLCTFVSHSHAQLLTPIGDLPGGPSGGFPEFSSRAYDMSPDGSSIVGESLQTQGWEAVRWVEGSLIQGLGLPSVALPSSEARGVSADGNVVAGAAQGDLYGEAFRWTPGAGMQFIGYLSTTTGNPFSEAHAISDDGSIIVGASANDSSEYEAFRWTQATGMVGLGTVTNGTSSVAIECDPSGTIIVGNAFDSTVGFRAMRWTEATGMQLLADPPFVITKSLARAISDDGTTIVGSYAPAGTTRSVACLWDENGVFIPIGSLPGGSDEAEALTCTADGSVVYGVSDSDNGTAAFVWDETNGLRNLQDVLEAEYDGLIPDGWRLEQVSSVSPDGRILAGMGRNENNNREGFRINLDEMEPINTCAADFNNDFVVDIIDFGVFGNAFGTSVGDLNYDERADFNNDGIIDIIDFGTFGTDFNRTDC